MTTKLDLGTLIGEWAIADSEARAAYARKKEIEFEINVYMREKYPDEYRRLEQGKATMFKAEGVKLSIRRQYDNNLLRAAIGEEYPDAFEQVTTEKINGKKLLKLWGDAAMHEKLSDTLIPSPVTVKIVVD